jgi:hypothetical protein
MLDLRKNKKSAIIITLGLMILQICLAKIAVSAWTDLGRALCENSCESYKLNGGGIAVIFFSQYWISISAYIASIICWIVEGLLLIFYLHKKMITFWFATISFTAMLLMLPLFR